VTRRAAWICATVIAVAFVGATVRLFVWPSTSAPRRTDAIVVFGARSPERLPDALRLANDGLAPVLVLMSPSEERSVCRDRPSFDVICRIPEPFTTRGEARSLGRLASERGWESVLLVTSTYHLTRARLLLERCFDGRVYGFASGMSDGFERNVERIAHEWGGLVAALTASRDC